MSEQAAEAIRTAIRDHGPITFAEFMELALYGTGGYYERPPVGREGDFVTSPHVHPVFATLIAKAVRGTSVALGQPTPLRVTEIGAGDGSLARQLLPQLVDMDVEYSAVEVSAGARRELATIDGVRVASELDGTPHVVLANELLDNLPFRRVRGDREVRIDLVGGRLVELETPCEEAPRSDGAESIVPVGAFAFIDRLAATLKRGYALLIDYGRVGSTGGNVHGYRDHRVIEDVLSDPGSTDVTAGVDFDSISKRAEARGLVAFGSVSQRDALLALGFEAWLNDELQRQRAMLDAGEGLDAVRTWSGRSQATLLIDPTALGRLRWLLLATPGQPAPAWLNTAAPAEGPNQTTSDSAPGR